MWERNAVGPANLRKIICPLQGKAVSENFPAVPFYSAWLGEYHFSKEKLSEAHPQRWVHACNAFVSHVVYNRNTTSSTAAGSMHACDVFMSYKFKIETL